MPLPAIVFLSPPDSPIRSAVAVPGSKSITNRALVLAALARGPVTLSGALWSEDTQVMVDALRVLGLEIEVSPDPEESGNRTIQVQGRGGRLTPGGSEGHPLELWVGNAGTAARFLSALVCLGRGAYRLQGVPRMHERPQAGLFRALRHLGYRVEAPTDRLPAVVFGQGPRPGPCEVALSDSSQYASALLLCAAAGGWQVQVLNDNEEESSYVDMTRRLGETFPRGGGQFRIEPDASSGSYFWAASWLLAGRRVTAGARAQPVDSAITVRHWPNSGWQIDARFPQYLPLPPAVSRRRDLGDSILTAMVLAPFHPEPVAFTDLGRLRVQECDRVEAMRSELTKCGVRVEEVENRMVIHPAQPHGAILDTYDDHRMAMSFAILGLKVPDLKIRLPACVKKTFPNFFQKLAAPAPDGLGVVVGDAETGRILTSPELFAD